MSIPNLPVEDFPSKNGTCACVSVYSKVTPIGQLIYFPVDGEIEVKYNQKKNAKYSGQPEKPIESMMWKNQF